MIELDEKQIAGRFERFFDIFRPGSVLRDVTEFNVQGLGDIINDFPYAEQQYEKSLFKAVDKDIIRMKQWNARYYAPSTRVRCHPFRNRLSHQLESESPSDAFKGSMALKTSLYHTGMAFSQLALCDDTENNGLIERILEIYKLGGWPCGMKGHGDKKRLIIFVPSHSL